MMLAAAGCSYAPGASPGGDSGGPGSDARAADAPNIVPVVDAAGPDALVYMDAPIVAQLGFVQGTAGVQQSNDNAQISFQNNETLGDFNVVFCSWQNSANAMSVTDNASNTYTKIVQANGTFGVGQQA